MIYVAHTAHWQFLGLMLGCVAWILTITTAGLNEWRLWYVADVSVVSSGLAWVGIWRACFYSHALSKLEFCQTIRIADSFVPVEIAVGQVLMLVAVICGLAGNITAACAVRSIYFSLNKRDHVRLFFSAAGTLYLLTGVCALVPLLWNMSSVLSNSTIDFPPEFYLPVAPVRQEVGSGIVVGIIASALMIVCGLLFLCYRCPKQALSSRAEPITDTPDPLHGPWTMTTLSQKSTQQKGDIGDGQARDNPAFQADEDL